MYGRAPPVLSNSLSLVLAIREMSFRSSSSRFVPRAHPCKRLAFCAVLALGAAGCGGGGKQAEGQIVRGAGYHFEAPAGWTVVRSGTEVQAAEGGKSLALVAVSRFPLIHRATERLAPKVVKELDTVADGVADQQNGRITSEQTTEVA